MDGAPYYISIVGTLECIKSLCLIAIAGIFNLVLNKMSEIIHFLKKSENYMVNYLDCCYPVFLTEQPGLI